MISSCAVVLTYPPHFFQTVLTLTTLKQWCNEITHITVIVDDFSEFSNSTYLDNCQKTYGSLCNQIVLVSESLPELRILKSQPWIRQQMIKLLLDKIILTDNWLFSDGDIRFTGKIPTSGIISSRTKFAGVPLEQRDPGPGETSAQILFYIRHMLDASFPGFWDNEGRVITASHPPIHLMERNTIHSLRAFLENKFSKPIEMIHKDLSNDTRMATSEWDLIEAYKQLVLKQRPNWNFEFDEFFEAAWSSDRELGLDWFHTRGLVPAQDIWQSLPMVKYL